MSADGRMAWPEGLSAAALRRVPKRLRGDAMQEARAAVLDGRNPNSAVRRLLRDEARRRLREPAASQLPARARHEYWDRTGLRTGAGGGKRDD